MSNKKYTLSKEKHLVVAGLFRLLCDGEPINAYASAKVIIHDECTIHGGEFHGGEFHGGVFHGGEFHGGEFHGGVFHGGVFRGGYLKIQIQGSMHYVNCSDGENIQIGCKSFTPEWWAENYIEVGRQQGYSDEQIEEYKRYIDLVTAMIKSSKK